MIVVTGRVQTDAEHRDIGGGRAGCGRRVARRGRLHQLPRVPATPRMRASSCFVEEWADPTRRCNVTSGRRTSPRSWARPALITAPPEVSSTRSPRRATSQTSSRDHLGSMAVAGPRGTARRAVPDRRELARLPRLLRAARVHRDRRRAADQRDLRLRVDAREDPHRATAPSRRSSSGTRASPAARSSTPSTRRSARSRPDLLKQQWPHLEPLVEAFGYRNVSVEGYEADDVIASIAEQARDEGVPVMIVTGDRDAFQLIDPDARVRVMATARGITETKIYDHQAVIDRYGIPPELIPDFYGLKGDTSDNIPGVPGIGDKTAAELLQRFGDLETVLASRRRDLRRQAQAEPDRARRRRARVQAARDDGPRRRRSISTRRARRRASPTAAPARGVPRVRAARPAAAPRGGVRVGRGGRARARGGDDGRGRRRARAASIDIAALPAGDERRARRRGAAGARGRAVRRGPSVALRCPRRGGRGRGGDCDGPEAVVGGARRPPGRRPRRQGARRRPARASSTTRCSAPSCSNPRAAASRSHELCEERGLGSALEDRARRPTRC